MAINKELLKILACPVCKSEVEVVENEFIKCVSCSRMYPIKENIPIMLIEDPEKI